MSDVWPWIAGVLGSALLAGGTAYWRHWAQSARVFVLEERLSKVEQEIASLRKSRHENSDRIHLVLGKLELIEQLATERDQRVLERVAELRSLVLGLTTAAQ